jgi:hypothetical protein
MYGCFGCLGMVAFLVMIVVGLAGIAYVQVGSEEISSEKITPVLPSHGVQPDSLELSGTAAPSPAPGELDDAGPAVVDPDAPAQGKVIIEATRSEIQVEPGLPGEALRVEASYEKNSYKLEESVETAEDGTWVYRVNFQRQAGWGFMTALRQMVGGNSPRLTVFLPPDVPLDLEATTSQGGLELELGGLWLRNAEIEFQQGGAEIAFSEPLHAPMQHLSVNGSMGGVALMGVGKASPRSLDIGFSMGGGFFDLSGPWQNDADISISASMGGGQVQLPTGLVLEGLDLESPRPPATLEVPVPTLRFDISKSSMESLKFSD